MRHLNALTHVSLFCAGQQSQQPQDYTKAWEEYYKKQGEWSRLCIDFNVCSLATAVYHEVEVKVAHWGSNVQVNLSTQMNEVNVVVDGRLRSSSSSLTLSRCSPSRPTEKQKVSDLPPRDRWWVRSPSYICLKRNTWYLNYTLFDQCSLEIIHVEGKRV